MVLKPCSLSSSSAFMFENDVEMYGTQTENQYIRATVMFENDVEMYGTQTVHASYNQYGAFENDVEMYGTQTLNIITII